MGPQHQDIARGKWFTLSLAEQLGNIGSEVHRALMSQAKSMPDYNAAVGRAFELIDLTLADPRLAGRLKEIARLRETFADATEGGRSYGTTLKNIDDYLMPFAIAARSTR